MISTHNKCSSILNGRETVVIQLFALLSIFHLAIMFK